MRSNRGVVRCSFTTKIEKLMVKSTFFLQHFNAWVTITQRQLIKHVQIEETVFLEAVNVLMDLVENLVQVWIH